MSNIRIRWKALIPLVAVVGSVLASPQFLALLPDKWSHVALTVAALIAAFTPAVATNRPPSDPPPKE